MPENSPAGTAVGALSAADPDSGQDHTFALVTGDGGADNGSFRIEGSSLKTAAVFDREAKSSYSIRMRTTDNGSPARSFERAFTVTVGDVNEAPTLSLPPPPPRSPRTSRSGRRSAPSR